MLTSFSKGLNQASHLRILAPRISITALHTPMSLQGLNDDVLTIILSYLEPHDALPLTTTCRSLHFPAITRLASEYDVVYLDPSNDCIDRLLKFCDYMLAYPQHRPAYLKALHLEVWKPVLHPLALNRLADVISHARALHTMSLYGDLNELGPSVMNAIVNADSLDCFRVDTDVPQMSLFSLSDVKFRPRVVTCLVDSSDPYTVTDPELIPKQLLNNIRELAIAGMLHIIEAMASHIVCPHVERLKIDDSTITAAQWDALMRTFPNVHTFRTTARSVPVFNTSASPYAGWSELDMVHALSPLPLRHCRVRRVELEIPMRQLPRCDLSPEMLDMLRCVSPVALTSWMNDELLDCVGRDLHSVNMLRLVKRADSKHVIPDATIGLVNHITASLFYRHVLLFPS